MNVDGKKKKPHPELVEGRKSSIQRQELTADN
jgi:hypothetical protein